MNINVRKSQRIALVCATPSSVPNTTSVKSPNTSLYTGAQITVDTSSWPAMNDQETTT